METKLKRWIIGTFCGTFALIVAIIVVWKLKFYDDVTSKLEQTNRDYETQSTTAKDLSKNLLAAAIAKDRAVLAKQELNYFRNRFRSLNFDLADEGRRNRTWGGYMNEYFADYGLAMRRELVQAAQDANVILATKLQVDPPYQLPEEVVAPASGFLKPVTGGTITVDIIGSLPNILAFLQRINRSAILMSVGTIKLEGPSPLTKATFTVTPFLVAKGPAVDALMAPGSVGAGTGATTTATTTTTTTPISPMAPATSNAASSSTASVPSSGG
jgi:hypothetical protein